MITEPPREFWRPVSLSHTALMIDPPPATGPFGTWKFIPRQLVVIEIDPQIHSVLTVPENCNEIHADGIAVPRGPRQARASL